MIEELKQDLNVTEESPGNKNFTNQKPSKPKDRKSSRKDHTARSIMTDDVGTFSEQIYNDNRDGVLFGNRILSDEELAQTDKDFNNQAEAYDSRQMSFSSGMLNDITDDNKDRYPVKDTSLGGFAVDDYDDGFKDRNAAEFENEKAEFVSNVYEREFKDDHDKFQVNHNDNNDNQFQVNEDENANENNDKFEDEDNNEFGDYADEFEDGGGAQNIGGESDGEF